MPIEVYDSLLDVPLDEHDPAEDGDDSLVPSRVGAIYPAPLRVPPPRAAGERLTMVAPYPGPLRRGSRNKAVRAINKGLSKAGFRRWQVFSFLFTHWTERALGRFLRAKGVPIERDAKKRIIYTRKAHVALTPHFDAYDIKYLLPQKPKPTRDEKERAAFVAQLMYLYNIRYQLAYTQFRPGDCRKPPRGADCSFSGEWAGEYSDIGSLSGYLGCGYGNTYSQLERYRRLGRVRESIRSAKPGDPKYYGSSQWNPTHVAFYIGHKDGRARVWSFGAYPVKILDASYRHDGIAVCNLTGR